MIQFSIKVVELIGCMSPLQQLQPALLPARATSLTTATSQMSSPTATPNTTTNTTTNITTSTKTSTNTDISNLLPITKRKRPKLQPLGHSSASSKLRQIYSQNQNHQDSDSALCTKYRTPRCIKLRLVFKF